MSWNVWGHEWAETLLKRHIERGCTRHAYLFTGAPGTGRRTLALRFAKALDCLNPSAPGEFCGECRNCRQIERMQHTDLFIGASDESGSTLKVETVRDIQHDLNMQPYAAPWRIALFLRFEEANASAQNALLKTLEEPPERSKLLLTACNENALLPTIGSRCEVIRLRPLALNDLRDRLCASLGMNVDDAARAAHLSAGRVGYAIRLAEQPDEINRLTQVAADGLELLGQNALDRFAYATGFKDVKKRPVLRETLQIWQSLFRDLMILSAAGEDCDAKTMPISYLDLAGDLKKLADKGTTAEFRACLSEINRMIYYLNANVNLQLLTESMFLTWPQY